MTIHRPAPRARIIDLPAETRMIATPWSRLVRGLGLGQYPVDYDPRSAERIRQTFALLATRTKDRHPYTLFAGLLSDLVLTVADPAREVSRAAVERALEPIIAAIRSERNPYLRLSAGCILMDAFAKLEIDRTLLVNDHLDLPRETLAVADEIEPDRIEDENAGRHGDYERLSGYSAVLLAHGQLGLTDRLVSGPRNHVREALDLLERIPSPFFRGRGGSMLLSVVSLLGFDPVVDGRDHIADVLDHLDRADELDIPPAFPGPMSPAFSKIYPLLTMLNAIAVSGRAEYLTHGRDRLAEARELYAAITPVERTHMALYYLVALHNLGRLDEQIPDLDAFVEDVVGQWRHVDPGADYFLNGISYPYIIQTAVLSGRSDLITGEMVDRLVDSFPDLDRSAADRANRPYPLSYALNVLGELGVAEKLYTPGARYGGRSPMAWSIERLSEGVRAEAGRFNLLNHALISSALRLRGAHRGETETFRTLRFIASPEVPSLHR